MVPYVMASCGQELCEHWSGDGDVCPCAIFGIERPGVAKHDNHDKVLADHGPGTYGRVYAAEAALVRERDAARAELTRERALSGQWWRAAQDATRELAAARATIAEQAAELERLRALRTAVQEARTDGTLRCPAPVRSALYAALDATSTRKDLT